MKPTAGRGGEKVTHLLRDDAGPSGGLTHHKALITAGGIGTRLLPFSKEIPKEMFPIITRNGDDSLQLTPVIQAIFEQLYTVGIRTFYFVVGRGKRAIEDHFSPDFRFLDFLAKKGKVVESLTEFYGKIKSSDLVFLNQSEPLGFGDAVLRGRPVVRGPFLVQAADTFILSENNDYLDRLASVQRQYDAAATVLLQEVADPRRYGVVEGDFVEDGVLRIASAVEKPQQPRSNYAIMPVYLFTEAIFDALSNIRPGVGGELQLTDAIQRLVEEGKPVYGVPLRDGERRLDIGSVETMIEALKISLGYVDEEWNGEPEVSGAPWTPAEPAEPEAGIPVFPLKPGRSLAPRPIPEKSPGDQDSP
jgi:UTP--glucose-1-phosphate uridylyltransferase